MALKTENATSMSQIWKQNTIEQGVHGVMKALRRESSAFELSLETHFGRDPDAKKAFTAMLGELKGSGKPVVANDICVGMTTESRKHVSFEPFELLNAARLNQIPAQKFTLNVVDISKKVLDSVKATKKLTVQELTSIREYLAAFFPESQRRKDDIVQVKLPDEWTRRIRHLRLDLNENTPPEADIAYCYPQFTRFFFPGSEKNLVASVKKGGFIVTHLLSHNSKSALSDLGVHGVNCGYQDADVFQVD